MLLKCVGCNRIGFKSLCEECKKKLEDLLIFKKFYISNSVEVLVPFSYFGLVRKFILDAKIDGNLSGILNLMNFLIERKFLELKKFFHDSVLVPVPSIPENTLKRGFVLTHFIAEVMSSKFYVNVEKILYFKRKVKDQSGLRLTERKENLKSVFGLLRKLDKEITIVDDLYVTGTTLSEVVNCVGDRVRKAFALSAKRL